VVEDADTTPSLTDSLNAAGTVAFSDVDLSDSHSVSFAASPSNTTSLGTFALGSVSEAPNAAAGSVGWTYGLNNGAAQSLAAGQVVTETYTVTVNDGHGSTTTQDVVITVTGTNDAPVITVEVGDSASASLLETNAGLLANGHVTVTEVDAGDVATLSVAGVSIDPSSTGATAVTPAALKAMMTVDQDGTWHFNSGSEAFNNLAAGQTLVLNYVLKADDGDANDTETVTVTITGTNDAPVAATLIDRNSDEDTAFSFTAPASTDVDSASLTYSATKDDGSALPSWLNFDAATRTFSGTPPQDFNGVVAVKMTTSDGSLTDSKTFNLTINPVNDAPVAVADTLAATEDTPVTYTAAQLLGNDTDVDNPNSALSIASVTSGAGGTAVLNANGTVTFTPTADFNGAASFTYTTTDGALSSAPATVTVNVAAVNDAPVAVADTLAATEDTPVTYTAAQLLGNDTDVDNPNSALSIASVTSGAGGTAVLNANGTVTFTPTADFNGAASFTYTTTDGALSSAPATVTVNVAAVNDAPVAVADTLAATEDTPVTYTAAQLLGNDTDVDNPNSALSIASVTSGAGGTAVLNANGTVTFTPTADFNGAASFTYTTTDGALTSAPATVTVNVAAVNDAPVFTSGTTGSVAENSAISTVVYDANVTDVDGAPAVFSLTGTDAGLFNINASTGEVTFKVSPNFEAPTDAGADNVYNFSVNAFDGTATTSQAVAVTVTNVNEAPVIDSNGGGATATVPVNENTTAVTTVHATDPDAGTTLVYSISGGADAGKFTINASTGVLSFISAPDFEAPTDADGNNSYIVQVRAFDGALQDDQTITVNVADVAEGPVDTQGPTSVGFTLAAAGATTDNGASLNANDAIGTFVAKGDPNSSVFHYALSGTNAGLFTLNPTTGALAIGASNLTSNATPYSITITALDQANNSVSQDVKVWVTGSGADAVLGVGTNVDLEYGQGGTDTLNGGAGDDALVGGQQGDVLIGGAGADQLVGGGGNDAFRFTGLSDAGDKIIDYNSSGTDRVELSVPASAYRTRRL
jgi:VCBS repeat-containing protein